MTTYCITWEADMLLVADLHGMIVDRIKHDEPITAATDSLEIAAICGLDGAVDHDKQTIFVTVDD